MKAALRKRLDILEENSMGKLYVVVYKGILPYIATVLHLGTGEKLPDIEQPTDEDLDDFLSSLPVHTKVIVIDCGGVKSSDLLLFSV